MDVPALNTSDEMAWELFYNDRGYYQAAGKFDEFIDEIDDTDVDLTGDPDLDELESNLSKDQIFALTAFNSLVLKYGSLFHDEDFREQAEEVRMEADSLDEYLSRQ